MANSTKSTAKSMSLTNVYAQAYTGIEDLQSASIYMVVPCRFTAFKEGSLNQAKTVMLPNNYPVLGGFLTLTANNGCKTPNALFAGSENVHFLSEIDGKIKVTHRDPWDDMAIQLGLKNITSKHIAEIMQPYAGYSFKSTLSGAELIVDEIMSGPFRGKALLLQDFILAHPGQLHIVAVVRNLPAIAIPKKTKKGQENIEKQALPIEGQDILYIKYEQVGSPAYLNVVDRPNQLAIVDVGDRVIQQGEKVEVTTKVIDTRVPVSLMETTSLPSSSNAKKKYYSRVLFALYQANPNLVLNGTIKDLYTAVGKGSLLPLCVFEMINKLREEAGVNPLTLDEHNSYGSGTKAAIKPVDIILPNINTVAAAGKAAVDELDAEEEEVASESPKSVHYKTKEEEEVEEGAEMF